MNIVFAHNVHNRLKTLKETILIEKKMFPDAHVSVASNDDFINIFQEISNFSVVSFNEKPHKIGCVNGCILSIQQLLDVDFDVLIFSHDDVYINEDNLNVVKKHIDSIVSGEYDLICRKPLKFENNIEIFGKYYMMEVFYISKDAVSNLFSNIKTLKNENEIPILGSPSPEVWLYDILNRNDFKKNIIEFELKLDTYNQQLGEQMGYHHENAGLRGWKD